MAAITAVPLEEALQSRTAKQPSERTLRVRRIEADSWHVVDAVIEKGAAIINLEEQDKPVGSYLNSLRAALRRQGRTDVLMQKKRGQDSIVVWRARAEDQHRMEVRRRTGSRLGAMAKQRAADRGRPQRR